MAPRAGPAAVAALALAALAACTPRQQLAINLLEDIAAAGGPSTLAAATPTPSRREVAFEQDGRPGLADIYEPGEPFRACLLLVPGFTREGKNDLRLVQLATSFARARFRVLVPEVPGTRDLQVGLDDARAIADAALTFAGLGEPACGRVGIAAISYSVGPAVIAALDDEVLPQLAFVLSLGGYHDTQAVVTFVTTGHFRGGPDDPWEQRPPDPAAGWFFLRGNLDALAEDDDRRLLAAIADRRLEDPAAPVADLARQLGPEGESVLALLDNRDPERVPGLIADLPEQLRRQMVELSLAERDLTPLAGRLLLIHGRADDMIPETESLALARAAADADLHLIPDFTHIDPAGVGLRGRLALICAVHALLGRQDERA